MSSEQEPRNDRPSGTLDDLLQQHLDPSLRKAALIAQRGDCPDATLLQQLADGSIRGGEADELKAHVKGCERCRALSHGFELTRPLSIGERLKRWLGGMFGSGPPGARTVEQSETTQAGTPTRPRTNRRFAALTAAGALATGAAVILLWPRATIGGIPEGAIYGPDAPERRLSLWREHGDEGLFPRVASLRGADPGEPEAEAVLPGDDVDLKIPRDLRIPATAKPQIRDELGETLAVKGEWINTRTYRFHAPAGGWPEERLYCDVPGVTSTMVFEALPRKGADLVQSEIRSGRRSAAELTQLFYMFGLKQRALRQMESLSDEERRRLMDRLKVDTDPGALEAAP